MICDDRVEFDEKIEWLGRRGKIEGQRVTFHREGRRTSFGTKSFEHGEERTGTG